MHGILCSSLFFLKVGGGGAPIFGSGRGYPGDGGGEVHSPIHEY